ncbi:MAG TPA: hypothetical protein VG105_04210 [Paraburkholderia sp.]|jgi:hypothetical protein|nr:hypothetical protein [Paraburkholderia sp.]
MNIEEVARYLFVSRVHVKRLLERGDLSGALDEDGQYLVDDASAGCRRRQIAPHADIRLDHQSGLQIRCAGPFFELSDMVSPASA